MHDRTSAILNPRTTTEVDEMKHRILSTVTAATLTLALAACDGTTGPEGSTTITFRAATGSASPSVSPGDVRFSHSDDPDASTLDLEGTNGQLSIASVHFIVSEFELERDDDAAGCDDDGDDSATGDDDGDDDGCEEFETGPQFLELPLTGDDAVAVRQDVPAGTYDELEFEIEDLEDDGDDDGAALQQLLSDIRDQFPEWPEEGSLRIHGTFTPKDEQGNLLGDEDRDFTVYFEAEVEIEKEFDPPVEITGEEQTITVTVDPRVWFERGDQTVPDLSALDFDADTGGPVPELEVEIENGIEDGFVEIEVDG